MTKLLIGTSGSLGILSIPSYLVGLCSQFPNLKIIMTHSATQFIPKETLGLFADGVYLNEFPISNENMGHIELARWAELFIVLPTSANLLSQVAQGAANSLLASTILAYKKKVLFFPNMNSGMWSNKAVQRNVRQIQEDGHKVIPPIEKQAYESASKKIEVHPVMPSLESVISILKLEREVQ
jgi:phosphopantothenoylcysteine synthetase/decarboxylase